MSIPRKAAARATWWSSATPTRYSTTPRRKKRSNTSRESSADSEARGSLTDAFHYPVQMKHRKRDHMFVPERNDQPTYGRLPTEIEGFESLAELALNLRWSWNHRADQVWRQIDPIQWKLTQNAWVVLQTASRDKLGQLLADPAFRKNVNDLLSDEHHAAEAPGWFQQHHVQAPLSCVAYFSLEFMLSEALPIYSSGLGNVSGDQLKSASDLGVPVAAVGLLYQQAFVRFTPPTRSARCQALIYNTINSDQFSEV